MLKHNLAGLAGLLTLFSASVLANHPVNETDSIPAHTVALDDVVVKASKNNGKIKELPASVSLFSSAQLAENEVRNLSSISASAPNFYMPEYGSKLTSPVYIRGIGSRINAPSVGLYVDQVPFFDKSSFNFDFFDIERIEVLRGPQGTLYGRNTMGGIVNIVTRSPFDYQGTQVQLSRGTYGSSGINAGHYGKAGNKFAYSLAANYLHNDGFYTNRYNNTKVDKLDSYGLRNRLIWKLTDRLTIENIASYEKSEQGGYPYAIYNDSLKRAEPINYNQYSSYNRHLFSDALVVKYSGRKVEFTSTTSYQYLSDHQAIDQDFKPDSINFVVQMQEQNMLSQEIILRSIQPSRYQWLVGAYGFVQVFDNKVEVDSYKTKSRSIKTYDHTIAGNALFHQSTLNDVIFPGLSVIAGIRLDNETDRLDYTHNLQKNGVVTPKADTTYRTLSSSELMPKLAVNYKFNTGAVYASVARGYKTGGFNSTFEKSEDLTFDAEYSWNYEMGVKMGLFHNHVFFDAALFYIDWRDQQIYQPVVNSDGVRVGSMLKNAGHSSSQGAEVSVKTIPVYGFDLAAAYGLTHAVFISNVVDTATNYNGNYIPYVPRHTFSVQVGKTFELGPNSGLDKIRISALYRGVGPIYWNEKNDHSQPFYGILDLKLSFINTWFQFDLWSKNLLNASYEAYYFEASSTKYVQNGKPMQMGASVSVKF